MLALLGLVAACRSAPPPPYPGSLVQMTVHVAPAAAQVAVSVDTAAPIGSSVSGGEWHGEIAVKPGPHTLRIEAFDAAGALLGDVAVIVTTARPAPAQVDATIAPARELPGAAALVAPRNSVVVGDRMLLQAGETAGASLAWSAAPAGCGSFADPSAAATEWTASAPGACTVTLATGAGGRTARRSVEIAVRTNGRSYQFPLRVAPGGRHLVDQRGTPFLIKGESPWLALTNLTEAEQERYLADRSAKGFNLVEVSLTNHDYTAPPNPVPPANRAGDLPFLEPGDLSTPNPAYFDRAAAFVDRAAAHGIAVLIAPNYLGFDGGREGWWHELGSAQNTRPVCAAFGRYLGNRFKDKKNVLWIAGGDFAPPAGSEGEARHWEIFQGLRAAGASQPWTGHWNFDHLGGISTDQARFREAMALNGVYQYANTYKYAARAYQAQPPRPVYLLESTYEHEHPAANTQPFRKAWWWTMLSGGSGVLWSNAFLWLCESARGTYRVDYGEVDGAVSSWEAELQSPGTFEMLHLHTLFESIPWHRLVPAGPASGGPQLVTSGQWPDRWFGQRHIAAAATPEGDLLVAYVPPAGSGSRSFALDLSRMRGDRRARWYDPSTGGWRPASIADHFDTPGANGSGTNDWVLVIEAR
jgi:hypothetical protein